MSNPFWQFSLAVYALPAVQAECLALQDAHDIDVNVLLFSAWIGGCAGIRLSSTNLDRARGAVEAWNRDVVKPLRQARRAAKALAPEAAALRQSMAEAELTAERTEQDILHALAMPAGAKDADGPAEAIVRCNIDLLLEAAGTIRPVFPEALAAASLAYAKGNAL